MDVLAACLVIACLSGLVGFILGRAYEVGKAAQQRIELSDLRRHIRESNERAS